MSWDKSIYLGLFLFSCVLLFELRPHAAGEVMLTFSALAFTRGILKGLGK